MPNLNLHELSDLCTPWCLHVAATLDLAGHLEGGPKPIEDLAKAAKCDPGVLQGLLEHLVSKGVFAEPAEGVFALNDAARQLLDPAVRIGLNLDGIGGRMAAAWGGMLNYVRTGKPTYAEIFGKPFWEDLDENPTIGESFDQLMGAVGHGTPSADFNIEGGWESVRTIVDVGGGDGAMLVEVLRAHPHMRGMLVDAPRAASKAPALFQSSGMGRRAIALGQSFFEPLPAAGDVYLLRGVLNNWPDEDAIRLLRRCAEAAHPHGRVVILKSVSPRGTHKGLYVDTLLTGGKHRTVVEFAELAGAAGLTITSASQQSAYFVVECRPVTAGE